MSFRAMAWAASVKTQTPTQKLILLLLADRANDDGFCFPSLQTIADDACVSRQCVIENIKKLAGHRLINVTRRTISDAETGQTRNTSNIYKLNTGVVNEVDHPSQRGLLGVVNEVDPNLSIEPINESDRETSADTPHHQIENKASPKPLISIPQGISDARKAALTEWLDYKKSKKQSYVQAGFDKLIKRLSGWDDNRLSKAIDYSMSCGYSGIFESKEDQQSTPALQPFRGFGK